MTRVFVGLGSNIDRTASLRAAVSALRRRFGELILSPVYESAAVGFEGDDFYNVVAAFDTTLPPQEVAAALHDIEGQLGRVRDAPPFTPRCIDLDLLLYGDLVLDGNPRLPRPDVERYAFVLKPLAEIAGDLRHPVTGERYRDMWSRLDAGGQQLRRVNFDWGEAGTAGAEKLP